MWGQKALENSAATVADLRLTIGPPTLHIKWDGLTQYGKAVENSNAERISAPRKAARIRVDRVPRSATAPHVSTR
jgi:hypothetical protein